MVKDHQVLALKKEYRHSRNIKIAALKTGMTRKTAAKHLKKSTLPSENPTTREYRTRKDPLHYIWPKAEEFLTETPEIEAKALFTHLIETYPGIVNESQLRTFQRRIQRWRIKNGDTKEVYFDQITIPGRMAQLDWLDMNKFKIEINGLHFKHKLTHFTLNHSNTESATICKSESILSIKKGLRDFLYRVVTKAPQILQVDNSSAATHRPCKDKKKRIFNNEYLEILNYYGIQPQKSNVGKPNENGVVESQNGHLKNKIKQALTIRGSKSFKNTSEYEAFINKVIDKANDKRKEKLQEEWTSLNKIPTLPLPEYQEVYVTVRNRSTVNIKKVTYSVPSRLIGAKLKAKVSEDKIDLYNGSDFVFTMPRVLGDRGQVIDYRHIIHSLMRKPAAFENYKYREELYPTKNFKKAWEELSKVKSVRQATIEYLRILKLSSDNLEDDVDAALELILSDSQTKLSIEMISDLVTSRGVEVIDSIELVPDLAIYDELFLNTGEDKNEMYH
jgi:hypothetical protein